MQRTAPSHRLSTKAPRSTWAASSITVDTINPEGLVGQVFLAVDRSGTSTNNNIYMLASVQPTGFSTGSDVMFVRSTDGGQTFSAPNRINDDPVNHNKWHWFGTLVGRAEWTDRFRLAGHAKRREQHRFAALLFLQHGRGQYLVAQRRGEQFVQSFPRLSESEQDGRLHDHRFGQYRRRCRLCRDVQSRRRHLLRSRRARDGTDADAFTHLYTRDANTYSHADTHSNSASDTDTDADTLTDPNSHTHSHTNANRDTDGYSNGYPYSHPNAHSESDTINPRQYLHASSRGDR